MKFKSAKSAREALGETIGWISDVEWLTVHSIESVFGPTGSFACFNSTIAEEFLDRILPWVILVKLEEDQKLERAKAPDHSKRVYFAIDLDVELQGIKPKEAGQAIRKAMEDLEYLTRAENRYQYYVGNQSKTQEELEEEFDFARKVLDDEVFLWSYLKVLYQGNGPYSFNGDKNFEEFFHSVDRVFWRSHLEATDGLETKIQSMARVAGILRAVVEQSDNIRPEETRAGDFQSVKCLELSQFEHDLPEYAIRNSANELGYKPPYSYREYNESCRHAKTTKTTEQKEESRKAVYQTFHKAESSLIQKTGGAIKPSRHKTMPNTQVYTNVSAASTTYFDESAKIHKRKWESLGRFALGAVALIGTALLASMVESTSETNQTEENSFWNEWDDFAGNLPDGTPTYWGPRGGRYYHNKKGRRTYI